MSDHRDAHELETALLKFLERPENTSGFSIHYRIGDAFSGETEFHLRGDGSYELRSTATAGREERTYEGRVDTNVVAELARSLSEAQVWETVHVRSKPREDDPPAAIAVEANGMGAEVELWVSEIVDSPPFRVAQEHVLRLVRELSNGEVLEEGR